jgi:hypothetical protein
MTARKWVIFIGGAAFLFFAGLSGQGNCGVDVRVGINIPLPVYTFPAPPPVVPIPGSYAYFVPDIGVEVLFYHGYWYRPYRGHWYRAHYYNGPWMYLRSPGVPRVLLDLPPDFRRIPPGHERIPYGQLRKNWNRWERERYWDRRERWPEEGPPGRRDGDRWRDDRRWDDRGPRGRGPEDRGRREGPPGRGPDRGDWR